MYSLGRVLILLPLLAVVYVHAKTGEEIADALYQHPNECKDPSDGGIWAPLQGENPDCGSGKKCKFPSQWCSATSDPTKDQNQPNLNCVELPPDCQKVVGAETTTAAPAETTEATTSATETTPTTTSATTQAASKATTKAGASAAPGATTTAAAGGSTPGCKDNHEFCCFWADKQQCDANPGWMRTQCQNSCGTCGCQASGFQSCKVKVNTKGCKYTNGGGGGKGQKVRIMLGGGPGIASMFPGGQGGTGSGTGSGAGGKGASQPNMVKIPVGGGMGPGMGFGGMPGAMPMGAGGMPGGMPMFGGGMPGGMPAGGTPGAGAPGGTGGKPSTIVTIPVGRKRRHLMPRWFNNV